MRSQMGDEVSHCQPRHSPGSASPSSSSALLRVGGLSLQVLGPVRELNILLRDAGVCRIQLVRQGVSAVRWVVESCKAQDWRKSLRSAGARLATLVGRKSDGGASSQPQTSFSER